MDIGQKIAQRRKELDLTFEAIANIVGVGKSTVRKWEFGKIENMRRDKIAKLAEALQVSPEWLMGWEEENKPAPSNEDELIKALRNDPIKMELAQIIMNLDQEALEKLRVVVGLVKSGLQ